MDSDHECHGQHGGGGGFYDEQFSINSADGCTDPNACNYDPAATCDDGSCDYGLWYLPNNVSDGPVTQACEAPEGYYLAVQSCIETVILQISREHELGQHLHARLQLLFGHQRMWRSRCLQL